MKCGWKLTSQIVDDAMQVRGNGGARPGCHSYAIRYSSHLGFWVSEYMKFLPEILYSSDDYAWNLIF